MGSFGSLSARPRASLAQTTRARYLIHTPPNYALLHHALWHLRPHSTKSGETLRKEGETITRLRAHLPLTKKEVEMARSVNLAILLGNLGADPVIRATASGARVAEISLATERTWNDRNGQRNSKTEWHRVIAWGPLADILERYARKGTQLHVQGSIEYRSYEDRDGQTKWTTEIRAQEISLLGGTRSPAAREEAPAPIFEHAPPPATNEATADAQMPFDALPSDPPALQLDAEEAAAVATTARKRR